MREVQQLKKIQNTSQVTNRGDQHLNPEELASVMKVSETRSSYILRRCAAQGAHSVLRDHPFFVGRDH